MPITSSSATPSRKTASPMKSSTTCWPIHHLAWNGSSSSASSTRSETRWASKVASAQVRRASMMALCFFFSTCFRKYASRRGWQPYWHCLQRFAAFHRRRRQLRVGNPALDYRERLAGSDRGSARSAFLQYWDLDLSLDSNEPKGESALRKNPIDRRTQFLDSDEEESRQQAPQDRRSRHRRTRRHW